MPVKPVPDGFHTVTPYLVVDGAAELIEFMKKAFGAEELHRSNRPDGGIMHAQVRIGDSMIMLADATKEHPAAACMLYLYVQDVDALYERAMSSGGKSILAPMNMFYGDRNGGVTAPGGVQIWIGTRVEDLSSDEIEKRAQAQTKTQKR